MEIQELTEILFCITGTLAEIQILHPKTRNLLETLPRNPQSRPSLRPLSRLSPEPAFGGIYVESRTSLRTGSSPMQISPHCGGEGGTYFCTCNILLTC